MRVAIYDFSAWDGFLLPGLFPDALRVPAFPGEHAECVTDRLPRPYESGLFFFHVDLTDTTRCPRARNTLCEELRVRGFVPVNAAMTSISKHRIQDVCGRAELPQTLAPRDGNPAERLIIKTACNYGGEPEMRLDEETRARLGTRTFVMSGDGHGYRVLPRCEVPSSVWGNPIYVVERYIDNAEHAFYRAFIMGPRVVLLEGRDDRAIRTISRSSHRRRFFIDIAKRASASTLPEPERTIAKFCAAFGVEFGCLDLVRDDAGAFYIIDVNPTPWWTRNEAGLEDHLLGGVTSFLGTPPRL